jgi:hypothetical protein
LRSSIPYQFGIDRGGDLSECSISILSKTAMLGNPHNSILFETTISGALAEYPSSAILPKTNNNNKKLWKTPRVLIIYIHYKIPALLLVYYKLVFIARIILPHIIKKAAFW